VSRRIELLSLLSLAVFAVGCSADDRAVPAERGPSAAELARQGKVVANGPFDEQSDPSYRGMSIFACDVADAARLSAGDPSVVAGRLTYDVMEWWVGSGSLAFPRTDGRVGERRSMPSD